MILKAFYRFCCQILLTGATLTVALPAFAQHLGGFLEDTTTDLTRPLLSRTEILNFLPDLGLFTFPEPYSTEAVRLTNAQNCGGGDCVNYVGYSYWRNTNNHVGQDSMLIFLGLDRSKGGEGPSLLEYNKVTDELTNHGPLFPSSSPFSWASGEGWYFSATMPTKLYVGNGGTEVLRYDVISQEFSSVFDITTEMGGMYLWQMHSSDDDRVHSATVRSSNNYAMLGCMAYEEDSGQFHYFPKIGDYDECQVDRSGRWLVIKENVDGAEGEDNRIIDLTTGNERVLLDSNGAAGHSDLGHGYMIAADNWANDANTQKLWRFDDAQLYGEVVYNNLDWSIQAPAHVSHTNARPDLAPEQQFSCGSSSNRSATAHANEIICFPLDGSGDVLVVAPVMTDLDSGSSDEYANSPKGNLDVTGQYFIWTSNAGGSRLDAFMVKVSDHLLTGGGSTPPPEEDLVAPVISAINTSIVSSYSATVAWHTDEPADSQIEYGLSTSYGNTTSLDSTLEPSHYQSLQDLSPGTVYHYRVKSRDATGNLAVSGDNIFTTTSVADTDAPLISAVSASGITRDSATITWNTDEPAEKMVEFGTSTAYGNASALESSLVTSHAVTLSGLESGTLYHYRVLNRDVAGNIASSGDFTFGTPALEIDPVVQTVAWTELVNVAVSGDHVQKNAGCDGCPDAGAVSEAQIDGNGYLEFTATADNGLRFIGLADDTAGTGAGNIDFALRLQNGTAEIRENGAYRSEVGYLAGDVFRITVDNGTVTYSKNGTLVYTSSTSPAGALRADTTFYSMGSSISGAVMTSETGTQEGASTLLGHWSLDDNSGTIATDASGNGFDGTLYGNPGWTGGVDGGGLSLDGVNDYVDISHNEALNAFPLSVSMWVKTGASGLHSLVNKYAPGSFNGYQVFVENGMLCAWYFRDSANHIWDGTGCTLSTAGVTDNQWHHVVFTVDENGGALYVDGVETASEAWNGTPGVTTTSQNFSLGRYPGTASPYLAGTLDDVRLEGRRLTAAEIADAFAAATVPQSGPQAVTWTDLVNVDVNGDTLVKSSGCNGCPDAGASASSTLSGNGYLEFTATANNGMLFIGLNDDATGTDAGNIDYAIRLQGNTAEVRENGVYKDDIRFKAGDVFRITVENGTVTYARKGRVFYTSYATPTDPLRPDVTIYSIDSGISQAVLASGLAP